jgi:glycosyltransferase involved in cell wall biosynthesis
MVPPSETGPLAGPALPAISVVIPTYNRGHIVRRAIQSALDQTLPPAEVIVVDDGSSDDTHKQVAAFAASVRYIHQPNAGSAVARHQGMLAARHEWVALLDSDDYWSPTHLERVAAAIEATAGQATFYFADTLQPPEKGGGSRWQALAFAVEGAFSLVGDGTEWVMLRPQPMMLQSSIFRRDAYLASGGFMPRLRYRDDTHLFLKMGLHRAICAVAGIGALMTADDDPANRLSLTYDQRKTRDGYWMQVWMFEDLLAHLRELHPATRSELQHRLADAHRGLARLAWRERRWDNLFQHILRFALIQSQRRKNVLLAGQ